MLKLETLKKATITTDDITREKTTIHGHQVNLNTNLTVWIFNPSQAPNSCNDPAKGKPWCNMTNDTNLLQSPETHQQQEFVGISNVWNKFHTKILLKVERRPCMDWGKLTFKPATLEFGTNQPLGTTNTLFQCFQSFNSISQVHLQPIRHSDRYHSRHWAIQNSPERRLKHTHKYKANFR